MTTLHGVQLGFKLLVSSLREEHLWAHFGLSGACTRSGRNDSSPLEKAASELQEVSGALTARQPDSHKGLFCRQHTGLYEHFALPLGGDSYQSSLLCHVVFATC